MLHDTIRRCDSDDAEQTSATNATTAACASKDAEMRFATPESRAAFLRPVLRAPQNKRLRVGPHLPFIDDVTAEDVRRSVAEHDQWWSEHVVSKKAKRSASF